MTPMLRAASCSLFALACAASPNPTSTLSAQPLTSPSARQPVIADEPAPPALTLVPLAPLAPLASARVEVDAPAFGDVIARDVWRRELVRVRVTASDPSARVLVSLDGQRPRSLPAAGVLALGELVPDQTELAPGAHELLAVLVSANGRLLRATDNKPASVIVGFFVGERAGELAASGAARLFCLAPWGTHYVSPANPLILELLSLGNVPAELPLRSATTSQTIDVTRAYVIEQPPLGDLKLRVGTDSGPHADCAVTVNPEPAAK